MAKNKRESIGYTGGGNEVRLRDDSKPGDITVKVDVDVSDAITGLKAVQREAKEATKALRELEAESGKATAINDMRDIQGQDGNWDFSESMRGFYNGLELASATLEGRDPEYKESTLGSVLKAVTTKDLTEELAKREGVEEHVIGAHGDYAHLHIDKVENGYTETITGPARIIVNKD